MFGDVGEWAAAHFCATTMSWVSHPPNSTVTLAPAVMRSWLGGAGEQAAPGAQLRLRTPSPAHAGTPRAARSKLFPAAWTGAGRAACTARHEAAQLGPGCAPCSPNRVVLMMLRRSWALRYSSFQRSTFSMKLRQPAQGSASEVPCLAPCRQRATLCCGARSRSLSGWQPLWRSRPCLSAGRPDGAAHQACQWRSCRG